MASIPPNVNTTAESVTTRPGETIFSAKPQPTIIPIVRKKGSAGTEEEESSESAVVRTSPPKKGGNVRLRFARFGRKHAPFYRIHAADSRSPRDGKFLERIGYYDPRPGKDGQKRMALNFERAKYWLSVGAQPSDSVRRILAIAGVLPTPGAAKNGSSLEGSEGVGPADDKGSA